MNLIQSNLKGFNAYQVLTRGSVINEPPGGGGGGGDDDSVGTNQDPPYITTSPYHVDYTGRFRFSRGGVPTPVNPGNRILTTTGLETVDNGRNLVEAAEIALSSSTKFYINPGYWIILRNANAVSTPSWKANNGNSVRTYNSTLWYLLFDVYSNNGTQLASNVTEFNTGLGYNFAYVSRSGGGNPITTPSLLSLYSRVYVSNQGILTDGAMTGFPNSGTFITYQLNADTIYYINSGGSPTTTAPYQVEIIHYDSVKFATSLGDWVHPWTKYRFFPLHDFSLYGANTLYGHLLGSRLYYAYKAIRTLDSVEDWWIETQAAPAPTSSYNPS